MDNVQKHNFTNRRRWLKSTDLNLKPQSRQFRKYVGSFGEKYCHVFECDSLRGFGLDIAFIDHFNTQLITTRTHNYSAIADLHILQFTRALSL
jgi:hypothetical protein